MERSIKIAVVQYEIPSDWSATMDRVDGLLRQARDMGADLAILPELFNQPYEMPLVPRMAEPIPEGRTCRRLSAWSRELGLHLVGGSIAEKAPDGRIFNTATLWDADGRLLAAHRKMHLFDVDLPGGVKVTESAVFGAGNRVTFADVLGLRIGLAVCYDVRFPELFRLMALAGVEFAAVPGAFNNVSGPAHWEMTLRNRAAENTFYVAGVSGLAPADAAYHSWGHSMVVDPFAEVLVNLERREGVGLAELRPERLAEVRRRLPVLSQRRADVYDLRLKD